jgi:putative colanic acid biosynthesis UDP-glucose lipid carrier transferase
MHFSQSGFIQRNRRTLSLLHKVTDVLIIVISLVLAQNVRFDPLTWQTDFSIPLLLAILFFIFFSEINETYRSWRGVPLRLELRTILTTWAEALLLLVLFAYLFKVAEQYSRLVFGLWFVAGALLFLTLRISFRLMFRYMRKKGYNTRKVAVAGAGEVGKATARQIIENNWLGFELDGFYSDFHSPGERPMPDLSYTVQGNLNDLLHKAKTQQVDQIYIGFGPKGFHNMEQFVSKLADTTVSIFVVPGPLVFTILKGQIADLGGMPVVRLFDSPFHGLGGWVKRIQDIILASTILALCSGPMLAIALGVKLSSPGPVFFRQRRYGIDGREIEVWKFRTMSVCEDGDSIEQARQCDPRVTRFGAFLRRTSLDELPQFINVLQGQMSIVGPRPHAVAHNEQYRKIIFGYMLRHAVKPGITGWAQVNGWRGETRELKEMEKRVEHDLWYIRNWHFGLDLKIIAHTILKGFVNRKAY